jgi:hypothetical protein
MPSPGFLFLFSTALLATAVVWPMMAQASRRRHLVTGVERRRMDLAPVHYAGPAVLIAASMALQLSANFL